MLELRDIGEHREALSIIRDWPRSGAKPGLTCQVADMAIGPRLQKGKYGMEDSPEIFLDALVSGVLPPRLDNAGVQLDGIVGEIRVPQLRGRSSRAKSIPSGQGSSARVSRFTAASYAAGLGRRKLTDLPLDQAGRRILQYTDVPPETILRDALHMMPYDRSLVDIDSAGAPLITHSLADGGGGFTAQNSPLEMIDLVRQRARFTMRDTPLGGHRASIAKGLGLVTDVVETYEARTIREWVPPVLLNDQYSHVEVYRLDDAGRDVWRAKATVDYSAWDYPPDPDTPLLIQATGTYEDGDRQAHEQADMLSAGLYGGSSRLLWHPLLVKGDLIRFDEEDFDDDGPYRKVWLGELEHVIHPFDVSAGEGGISTLVKYRAWLYKFERPFMYAPTFGGEIAMGVVQAPLDVSTQLYPGDTTFPDETVYPS